MMEILFRGKRIDNGEWVNGYVTRIKHSDDKGKVESYYFNALDELGWVAECVVSAETVCQYAGLTDKNGRKIFEGDIVRAIYKPKDEDLTTDDFIIKWDKYYCKYVGYYARKENVYNPLLFGSQISFEVIGNIFDNPELLEGGKEKVSDDLISRSALMQSLRNNVLIDVTPNMEQAIEEHPTAYDVDQVVNQIRKFEICGKCLNNHNSVEICAEFCDVGKKLRIIKSGGIE